jgi:hypothetical protein
MSIVPPSPVTITPATHRFFDDLVTALASQAALVAGYSTHAQGTPYRFLDDWTMRLGCKTQREGNSTLEIEVKPAAMLTPLTQFSWPTSLDLNFGVVTTVAIGNAGEGVSGVLSAAGQAVVLILRPMPDPPAMPPLNGMARLEANIMEHAFIAYYERHLDEINAARSRDNPTLAFANAIRNAFSHGGSIHFTKAVTPVTWGGLSYSEKDNGRQVLYNDMSQGDVILLMLDMDKLF